MVKRESRLRHPSVRGKGLFSVPIPQETAVLARDVPGGVIGAEDCLQQRRNPYEAFYRSLGQLREEFHRLGHFDDANAKLDELCKLLVLKVLDARYPPASGSTRLTIDYLRSVAKERHGSPDRIAGAIHDVFSEIMERCPGELEAFGPRLVLNMRRDDDAFALALVPLLESLPLADGSKAGPWAFDGLNEAFGHFVQDSFRNRKEDAQYMTPPEVVSNAIQIAFIDLLTDLKNLECGETILVADPTCGVGSFLAAAYRHARHVKWKSGDSLVDRMKLVGQDKVERMVRLANVNLKIFARTNAEIRLGNSIVPPNSLDDLTGKVHLIVTNPPFGATFSTSDIMSVSSEKQYPILFSLRWSKQIPKTLDSEYLLLDRELALLRPGGRLIMVVPDHVVSGNGFSETFRLATKNFADLIGVIDLPTETFAQAGTRTKTSLVYLRRHARHETQAAKRHVFMANSVDLGFKVISRAGASVKHIVGQCDLDTISDSYRMFRQTESPSPNIVCLSRCPSIAVVPADQLLNNRWTAGFYQSDRLEALESLDTALKQGFDIQALPDLVEIDGGVSERVLADTNNRCISVLHVGEDGCIDISAVEKYKPTTPGSRCRPGDVLLSKINPRITRVCVVPDLGWQLGCSSEFAVLRPRRSELTAWALLLLMRSAAVQTQIRTLTSGTSSSHNRIKDRDLASIRIPVPKAGTSAAHRLNTLARDMQAFTEKYYETVRGMQNTYKGSENLLGLRAGSRSRTFPT